MHASEESTLLESVHMRTGSLILFSLTYRSALSSANASAEKIE
jgi:hypothetical protein